MAKILAILDVDEKRLAEHQSDLTTEFGWLKESGITLADYRELSEMELDVLSLTQSTGGYVKKKILEKDA